MRHASSAHQASITRMHHAIVQLAQPSCLLDGCVFCCVATSTVILMLCSCFTVQIKEGTWFVKFYTSWW